MKFNAWGVLFIVSFPDLVYFWKQGYSSLVSSPSHPSFSGVKKLFFFMVVRLECYRGKQGSL